MAHRGAGGGEAMVTGASASPRGGRGMVCWTGVAQRSPARRKGSEWQSANRRGQLQTRTTRQAKPPVQSNKFEAKYVSTIKQYQFMTVHFHRDDTIEYEQLTYVLNMT